MMKTPFAKCERCFYFIKIKIPLQIVRKLTKIRHLVNIRTIFMNTLTPNQIDQIADVAVQMMNDYAQFAKKHNVNDNELGILYTLWVDGACSQSHIAQKQLIAKQTVNTLCQKFIKDGLLISQPCDTDKRQKVLHFTDKGRAFAEPIIADLLAQENKAIAEFGVRRVAFLLNELKDLQGVLAKYLE